MITDDYQLETAPVEDVACEAYEFQHTHPLKLAHVLGHIETDLLQALVKMLNAGRRIAVRLVRKKFYDPCRSCHVHHMRVEADDVHEIDRQGIVMRESPDLGFSRRDGRTRRLESYLVGEIPAPLLRRLDPPPAPPAPPTTEPWYRKALAGIRETWEESKLKPLPPRDDDTICRLKREARLRGEGIVG